MKKLGTLCLTLIFFFVLSACQNETSNESIVLNQIDSNGFPQMSGSFIVHDEKLTIKKTYGNALKANDMPESSTNITDEQQEDINRDSKNNSFTAEKIDAGKEYTSTFKKVKIEQTDSELLISSEENSWQFEKNGDRLYTDQNGVAYELSE